MTLELSSVSVSYGRRRAVTDVSLTFAPGRLIGLIGPNGAGKSSLLKALGGLVACDGSIAWSGRSIDAMSANERARTLAYLAQTPAAHWPLPVERLVALGRLPHRRFGEPLNQADSAAVHAALAETKTSDLADRGMNELSGGEFSLVQLARALCVEAPVLLVDEPMARLDPYHQLEIMDVLLRYAASGGLVIAVLHDLVLAARFCDRVVLLERGRVAGDGPAEAVLDSDTLRQCYGIETFRCRHENQTLILPWSTAAKTSSNARQR
jgi:iron complex transport system ATP-binding protein